MANGRLSVKNLSRVYHPTAEVYLEKEAAAAWNTMRLATRRYLKTDIYPGGPDSAYRTFARQQYYRTYWCNLGNCGNAAVPGTSNHGIGMAVDLASQRMRFVIDRIGAKYGWAKKWSDAPQEWWHLKYRPGVWKVRPNPGIDAKNPTLRKGSGGIGQAPWVKTAQKLLKRHGFYNHLQFGEFDATTHNSVKAFQKAHKLKADGKIGAKTWWHLRQKPKKAKPKPTKPKPSKPAPAKPAPTKPKPKAPKVKKPVVKKPIKTKPTPTSGVDVYSGNGTIDWHKTKKDGQSFAFIATGYIGQTNGGYHVDSTFTAKRIATMRKAGVTPGYYSYLIPNNRQNPKNLAKRIVTQIKKAGGLKKGDLPFSIDVEESKLDRAKTFAWISEFEKAYTELTGHKPIIYAGAWWRDFLGNPNNNLGCKLWLAAYVSDYKPYIPKAWKSVTIWQYAEDGKVNGINGNVDMNKLLVFIDDLTI